MRETTEGGSNSFIPFCPFPQLISESVLPLPPPLSASVLSDNVERERDEQGQETFRVRALFHKRGIVNTEGTCITLHAFKDTKEHKASCITQVRMLFCVFSLHLSPTHLFHCFALLLFISSTLSLFPSLL